MATRLGGQVGWGPRNGPENKPPNSCLFSLPFWATPEEEEEEEEAEEEEDDDDDDEQAQISYLFRF